MWSLFLLLNKLMKPDDEDLEEAAVNHLSFATPYTINHSSNTHQHRRSILSHYVDIPHICQERSWDCGLACVLMVFRALGIHDCDIQDLFDLCRTTSIWTVDLAYLLQKFSVSFTYSTVTIGANPDFSVEDFYREQLPDDVVRVNMLFQEACEAGIHIECRSVGDKEISELILSGKYVVIALVDHYKLSHSQIHDVSVSDLYSCDPGYMGHYIVICGYDTVTKQFEIRDPASSRRRKFVTSCSLDQARKSFGTDEDLLLISLERGRSNN